MTSCPPMARNRAAALPTPPAPITATRIAASSSARPERPRPFVEVVEPVFPAHEEGGIGPALRIERHLPHGRRDVPQRQSTPAARRAVRVAAVDHHPIVQ